MVQHLTIYENCSLGGIMSVMRERMRAMASYGIGEHFYFLRDHGGVASLKATGADSVYLGHLGVENNISRIVQQQGITTVNLFSHFHLSRFLKRDGVKVYLELHDCPPATVAPVGALKGHFDKIIVPSAWSRDWVNAEAGIPVEDIEIIPNFINDTMFRRDSRKPVQSSRPKPIIWVGRLDERKNWRDAAYIASLLKKRGLKIKPIFVLSLRSEDQQVHDFIDQLSLLDIESETRIYFNLSQAELADMMRDCAYDGGCFLSTARLESFGLGIVEAMACGLPVVASAVGAVPEHIVHGETGFLFPFGERVLAADFIEECLFVRGSRQRVLTGLYARAEDERRHAAIEQLLTLARAGNGPLPSSDGKIEEKPGRVAKTKAPLMKAK